jgi:hypothetical protein
MHQVQLPEPIYKEAQRRAADAGYSNVDEYVTDLLSQELAAESDFDQLFTPERIAQLDQVSAEINAGAKTFTMDEVRQHFQQKGEVWRQNHAD